MNVLFKSLALKLVPKERHESIISVDFDALADRGIRNHIVDVDNTIALRNAMTVSAEVYKVLDGAIRRGSIKELCLLSNVGVPGNGRVARVREMAESLGAHFFCAMWPHIKPRPRPINRAMEKMGAVPSNTTIIGDQLFTDVRGGNALGLYTIWVDPLGPDHIMTCWRRWMERIIMNHWKKNRG